MPADLSIKHPLYLLCVGCLILFSTARIATAGQLQSPNSSSDSLIVIRGVRVIDTQTGTLGKNVDILISGDRIVAIKRKVRTSGKVKVYDVHGMYAIPGLWDMHTHILRPDRHERFSTIYLANGVTTVRDMGCSYDHFLTYKSRQQKQEPFSFPEVRIFAAGPFLDGEKPTWPALSMAVSDEASAREAVRELKKAGADFIKVYNLLSKSAYFAIADECRKQDLPLTGHVPFSVTINEAISAGQRTIEHLSKCMLGSSSTGETLDRQLAAEADGSDGPTSLRLREIYDHRSAESFDHQKFEALLKKIREANTFQCPTLVLRKFFADTSAMRNFASNNALRFYDENLRQQITGSLRKFVQARTPADIERSVMLFKHSLRFVRDMNKAGVPLLAGTDVPGFGTFPGLSLHDELALFVDAGLTPFEALKTATINAARALRVERDHGSIEQGKVADIVILSDNPLQNINNTRMIELIVAGGVPVSRQQLAARLEKFQK